MKQFIKTSIEKIRDAMDNNKLVIFVGAGVSANSNYPSWNMLISKFADELGILDPDRGHSVDSYLKIPQYYFIERGKKEYFDIIDKVFNTGDYSPNAIHDLIFELKPSCIVTTNFDDLLEQTIKKNGLFYTVIKQDSDLPYCINDNLIIKMHGDSCLKNIVLKEEDYLNYSKLFPLIENYLKALFSTKTILFVGYSAEDPDFKLLFQWVKNELAGHFQPAYLLETDVNEDKIKFNYYKNRGINILYFNNIESDVAKIIGDANNTGLTDSRGVKLYEFLKYIKDYMGKENSRIDVIYNKLCVFEEMNYIMVEDLYQVIDIPFIYDNYGKRELYFHKCKELLKIVDEVKNYNVAEEIKKIKEGILSNSNLEKALRILSKAGVNSIKIDDISLDFSNYLGCDIGVIEDELDNLLIMFKYNELASKLEFYLSGKPLEGNENKYLRKAYLFYRIGEYKKSYDVLRSLSIHSFAKKKYFYYFIAQFNIKQLRPMILYNTNLTKEYEETYNKIIEEIDGIDIEKKYMDLPIKHKSKVAFIMKLSSFNYFYKSAQKLIENINELDKSKQIIESGGFAANSYLLKSYHIVENILRYIRGNYVLVEHYKEVKSLFSSFVECYLIWYSIDESKGEIKTLQCIDRFVLNIIIEFVDPDRFLNLINKYKVKKITISTEEQDYLCEIFSNIEKAPNGNRYNDYNQVINRILAILRYTDITSNMFNKITMIFIKKNMLDGVNYTNFSKFIISKFNNDESQVDVKSIGILINNFLKKIVNKTCNGFEYHSIYNDSLIDNLVKILISMDKNIVLKEDEYAIKLINEVEYFVGTNERIDEINDVVRNILMCIYPIMGENAKRSIELLVNKIIILFSTEKNQYDYIIYIYIAIIKEIKIDDYENSILNFVVSIDNYVRFKKEIEKQNTTSLNSKNTHEILKDIKTDHSDKCVKILLYLIRTKKIIYESIKSRIPNVISNYPKFEFLVDMHNFNYDNFNQEWLCDLSDEELDALWKIAEAKNKICELLKIRMKDRDCSCLDPFSSVIKKLLIPQHKE